MELSVIVPTFGRDQLILPTVRSLIADRSCRLEVIVVDQSTSAETERALADSEMLRDERVKYHRTATVGASRCRNEGIRHARAPLVAFVDDDCVVCPRWPSAVRDRFVEITEMSVLFGNVVAALDASRGWIPEFKTISEGRVHYSVSTVVRSLGLTANLAVRQSALQVIGGFDELMGPGTFLANGEDTDFGYRALRSGLGVYAFSEPHVIHRGLRSSRAQIATTAGGYLQGLGAFCMKHARCGELEMLYPAVRECLTLFGHGGLHLLSGRRPSGYRGAVSVIHGLGMSWRYSIDSRHRLYRPWNGQSGRQAR